MTAGQLIDDLLRRVRDPQGTAHPRPIVRDLLDRSQVLFVRYTSTLIRERAFVQTPQCVLFPIDPADTLRILDIFITATGKRLWMVRWSNLAQQFGQLWWRHSVNLENTTTTWATVGTQFLAVWPMMEVGDTSTMTIREQRRPTALGDDTVEIELPDEYVPALLDFVEALLLLRGRDAALVEALPNVEAQVA